MLKSTKRSGNAKIKEATIASKADEDIIEEIGSRGTLGQSHTHITLEMTSAQHLQSDVIVSTESLWATAEGFSAVDVKTKKGFSAVDVKTASPPSGPIDPPNFEDYSNENLDKSCQKVSVAASSASEEVHHKNVDISCRNVTLSNFLANDEVNNKSWNSICECALRTVREACSSMVSRNSRCVSLRTV